MAWRIEIDDKARRDLAALDKALARRLTSFLRERVAKLDDPRSSGDALKGPGLGCFWKYRVGDYRIIASIEDDALCILVVRIGHRGEEYRR